MRTERSSPSLHVRPAAGQWCNDPNGPLFHEGRYHLFFQHNPHAPVWGDIHWGHASSPDLVTWTDHGVALAPTPGGRDALGAWSGCAVVDDGVPTAVYTGMDRTDGIGSVMLARAADAFPGTLKAEPRPVVDGPPADLDLIAFRDPYLFTRDGERWALVGAGHRGGRPDVLLYRVHSLTDWSFAGSLLDADDPLAARFAAPATAWECPALVPSGDGRWILFLSLWVDDITYLSAYLTGTLEEAGQGLRFQPTAGGRLDHGHDFYAPTALVEEERTLVWGWSWESRTPEESEAAGWAGCITHPRELDVHADGTARLTPARELTELRTGPLRPGELLPAAYELELSLTVTEPDTEVSLQLGESVALRLDPTRGLLVLDRAGAPARSEHPMSRGPQTIASGPVATSAHLRVFVDGPLLEVFWNDRVTLTEKIYPAPEGPWSVHTIRGTADVEVTGWRAGEPNPA